MLTCCDKTYNKVVMVQQNNVIYEEGGRMAIMEGGQMATEATNLTM